MCTRYYIEPEASFQELFENLKRSPLTDRMRNHYVRPLKTSGEILPTDLVPVIAPSPRGESKVYPMIFGYKLPKSDQPLLNARSETAGEKPTFAEGWQKHRCIIPASYYYEWEHLVSSSGDKKTGDKYMIQPAGATETWLCGLYRIENGFPHFVILTKDPAEELKWLHDRMPVMLPKDCIQNWIDPENDPGSMTERFLSEMIWEKVTMADTNHLQ